MKYNLSFHSQSQPNAKMRAKPRPTQAQGFVSFAGGCCCFLLLALGGIWAESRNTGVVALENWYREREASEDHTWCCKPFCSSESFRW